MKFINDEEDLLVSLKDFVKANLNNEIDVINSEKADFAIDLISQNDTNYIFAGEMVEIPNHAFVNFAIDGEVEIDSNHGDKISLVNIMIEVVFDHPKKSNTYFTSLRYMRALYQTLSKYETSAIEVDGFKITKAIPMVVTTNTGRNLVVSGVGVSVALG